MAVDITAFGRTLSVTKKGEIYYHENDKFKKIRQYMHQGKRYVRIAKRNGDKNSYHQHRVDQLVCFAYKNQNLEQRQRIEYVDGDPSNCAATNLRIVSGNAPSGSSDRKCARGHQIVEGNVHADKRYPNSFSCKSCANAKNWLRNIKRKDLLKSEKVISLVADVYYDKYVLKSENAEKNWKEIRQIAKTVSGPEEFVLE